MKDKCWAVFFCFTHILSFGLFHIEKIISKFHIAISRSNERKKRNKGNPRVAQTHIITHTEGEPCRRPPDPFLFTKTILETCNGISIPDWYINILL